MGLKNKDGVDLSEVWANGIRTYLGMLVHGFPNAFFVYTPQGEFSSRSEYHSDIDLVSPDGPVQWTINSRNSMRLHHRCDF